MTEPHNRDREQVLAELQKAFDAASKASGPPKTAQEILAEQANDEDYQTRKRAADGQRKKLEAFYAAAEQPIIADLLSVGIRVRTIWDLVNRSVPYPEAIPVLQAHLLSGDYPDRTRDGLARSLAVPDEGVDWNLLMAVLNDDPGPEAHEGVIVALAAIAGPNELDDLRALVFNPAHGKDRAHLFRALRRIGTPEAKGVLEALLSDPLLDEEARRNLR